MANKYNFVDGVYVSPTHSEGNRATRRLKAHPIHSNNKKDNTGRKWNLKKDIV